MRNRLKHLSIRYGSLTNTQALVSSIPLRRDAELSIYGGDQGTKWSDILNISVAHLSNPLGPTLLEIQENPYTTQLLLRGPGGALQTRKPSRLEEPLIDFCGASFTPTHQRSRNSPLVPQRDHSHRPNVPPTPRSTPQDTFHRI